MPIGFEYYSDDRAPALQLRITKANYYDFKANPDTPIPDGEGSHWDSGFATIVLSPADADESWKALTPEQVSESDEFWVTKSIAATENVHGGKPLMRYEKATLKDIIAMNPGAQLDHVGIQKTRENSAESTYADNFRFGCETTDFELDPKETAPAPGPDFGSLALGGGLALAAALAVGGGAFAIQNGMIQLPPELAALLPA